jgi:methylmalonyl-CoA mutase N-terminal domain/subunit
MRDRFGASNARAQQLRFHAQTAGSTLAAQQPDNNIVRVALQALAAVLGGAQSLHCNGRDEALGLPTQESASIALRTQQILLHESGVAHTADPVGGSYAIEELTNRIERDALALIERIDAAGGALAAIESGDIQQQIQDAAYRAQQAIDAGETIVVGVNRFADDASGERPTSNSPLPTSESHVPTLQALRVDPEVERQQVDRLRAVRAGRSAEQWRTALAAVERAAQDGSNLVPPIVAAVESRATVGEIADVMRRVFGEYREQ